VSLNYGIVHGCSTMNDGYIPGWDTAGIDPGAASTLPVAGVTALQSLRRLGSLLGKRVLITGASGGVGRFAVQPARRAGAFVVCQVGNPSRGEGLAELGASQIITSLDEIEEPIDGALDIVGGPGLSTIFSLLSDGGSVQYIGAVSGEPTVFEPYSTVGNPRRRLESFTIDPAPVQKDLAYPVSLLSAGELDPQIDWRGSWDRYAEAFNPLLGRRIRGKVVLDARQTGFGGWISGRANQHIIYHGGYAL